MAISLARKQEINANIIAAVIDVKGLIRDTHNNSRTHIQISHVALFGVPGETETVVALVNGIQHNLHPVRLMKPTPDATELEVCLDRNAIGGQLEHGTKAMEDRVAAYQGVEGDELWGLVCVDGSVAAVLPTPVKPAPAYTKEQMFNGKKLTVYTNAPAPTRPSTPIGELKIDIGRTTDIQGNTAHGNVYYTHEGKNIIEWFTVANPDAAVELIRNNPRQLIAALAREIVSGCYPQTKYVFEFYRASHAVEVNVEDYPEF